MKRKLFLALLLSLNLIAASTEASIVIRSDGIYDAKEVPTFSLEDHYGIASEAYNHQDWKVSALHFRIVTTWFPQSNYAKDGHFYLAICYMNLEEYECANDEFSEYLKCQDNPEYFEDTILYKFQIAEIFRGGERRRALGYRSLPKILSGQKIAFEIYDEIIATVPCHEVAAYSLYSKGLLMWQNRDFGCAIEAFQLLIRRFPKHELTPLAYLSISEIYLCQCQYEFQNPDLLVLSQLNLRKFSIDFPADELLCEVQENVMKMKEIYASGLYETGLFYERTCHPSAALIYYKKARIQFPDTEIARICDDRINILEGCGIDEESCDDDCCEDPCFVEVEVIESPCD